MPHKCVVGGCSNVRSLENGIGLHTIPFYGDERPEAKKRRMRWIDFVRLKHVAEDEQPLSNRGKRMVRYFTSLCPVVLGMICL